MGMRFEDWNAAVSYWISRSYRRTCCHREAAA